MIQQVPTADLAAVLAKPDVALVDVRSPQEYAARHIPGARLAPVDDIERFLGELPRDKDLYVTCEHGMRSQYACEYLEAAGFTRLFNVQPGMSAWRGTVEKGLPKDWT